MSKFKADCLLTFFLSFLTHHYLQKSLFNHLYRIYIAFSVSVEYNIVQIVQAFGLFLNTLSRHLQLSLSHELNLLICKFPRSSLLFMRSRGVIKWTLV